MRYRQFLLLGLVYTGFISLGLPDGLLGAAWPAIRTEYGLPLEAAATAVMLATAGVVLSSMASGLLLERLGTGAVLAGSSFLAAAALVLCAWSSSWDGILAAALLAGLGGGAVDSALNGFVAREYGARHMNWLHACWSIGATIGPLAVAAALDGGRSWRVGYEWLAGAELLLAAMFLATLGRWPSVEAGARHSGRLVSLSPAAIASVLMFIVYCGLEMAAGLWGAIFLIEFRGATVVAAGTATAAYWGSLAAGRILLGAVADGIEARTLLAVCIRASLAALLILGLPGTPVWVSYAAFALLGFALAPIYPALMHDTPRRFGPLAHRLVGYQVAAGSLGIALVPWLSGLLAATASVRVLPAAFAAVAVLLLALDRLRCSEPAAGNSQVSL